MKQKVSNKPRVETTFRAFEDGTIVELVRTPKETGDLQLLIWKDGHARLRPHILKDGEFLVPPDINRGFLRIARLPSGISPYRSVGDLFALTAAMAQRCLEMKLDDLYLLAAYVLATWLADRFTRVPYLSVVGPIGSGKTQLLQFLSTCCRRSVLASDLSIAALYSATDQLHPTLLIDEVDFGRDYRSREMQRLLRGGHTANTPIIRGGRAFQVYGAKVLCGREPIQDAALASRTVQISMLRSQKNFPALNDERQEYLAQLLQPQLLLFRLRNYSRAFDYGGVDLSGLSPRSRDLATVLVGPLGRKKGYQQRIVDVIRRREGDVQARQSNEPELVILDATFRVAHLTPGAFFTVGAVSDCANELLETRGERPRFEPRGVGPILRALGFLTGRVGCAGIGVVVTADMFSRLHKLVRDYDMIDALFPKCSMCAGLTDLQVVRQESMA